MPAISTQTPIAVLGADLDARQADVLTQILAGPDGGVTTAVVTLGDPTPTFTPDPMTTTAFGIAVPIQTSYWDNVNLSQPAIGGILGAIVGVIVIGLIGAYCAFQSRSSRSGSSRSSSSRSYSSSGSSRSSRGSPSKKRKRKHRSKTPKGPTLIPPPTVIPPTPLPATYKATWKPQIKGVSRY